MNRIYTTVLAPEQTLLYDTWVLFCSQRKFWTPQQCMREVSQALLSSHPTWLLPTTLSHSLNWRSDRKPVILSLKVQLIFLAPTSANSRTVNQEDYDVQTQITTSTSLVCFCVCYWQIRGGETPNRHGVNAWQRIDGLVGHQTIQSGSGGSYLAFVV